MAAIPQIFTSNTFGQWVTSTQEVITKLNTFSEGGNGTTFFANTNVEIANNLIVRGNVTVSGNIILDEIGFDDLFVNGSATISNTLSVTGQSTLSNTSVANANVAILSGAANTQIYSTISASANGIVDTALAFSIALS